jgi:hypothetical protein
MAILIDADDSRSIKAVEIAAGASRWIKCTRRDGRQLLGIPSQCKPGTFYLVDPIAETCDCQDSQRNGLNRARIGQSGLHVPCKHVRGVLLHLELARAQQAQPRQRSAFDRYDRSNGEIVYLPHRARIHNTQRED